MNLSKWPYYDSSQISKVREILSSGDVNYWTGSETKKFEEDFANYVNCNHAIAIANGSLALSSAYLSIDLKSGDEVITTPRTFIATASSAVLLGAKPVFADVDINSGNITAKSIEPLINSRTKAIVVVHFNGWPADMIEITDLAKKYNIYLIEDCAQAHGAHIKIKNKWKSVGSFGDVSAWSFCQDKIISTGGEGGMVTTSSLEFWDRMWSFKDHGKTWNSVNNRSHPEGFRWVHDRFGSNFRLTEIQSAIGRIQLHNLNTWNQIRTRNALIISNSINNIPLIRVPLPSKDIKHAWYKFYCYIRPEFLAKGWSRNKIVSEINSLGFPAFHGGCGEIYLERCFEDAKLRPNDSLSNAKKLGETSLMFLLHPTIDIEEIKSYAHAIQSVCQKASI